MTPHPWITIAWVGLAVVLALVGLYLIAWIVAGEIEARRERRRIDRILRGLREPTWKQERKP